MGILAAEPSLPKNTRWKAIRPLTPENVAPAELVKVSGDATATSAAAKAAILMQFLRSRPSHFVLFVSRVPSEQSSDNGAELARGAAALVECGRHGSETCLPTARSKGHSPAKSGPWNRAYSLAAESLRAGGGVGVLDSRAEESAVRARTDADPVGAIGRDGLVDGGDIARHRRRRSGVVARVGGDNQLGGSRRKLPPPELAYEVGRGPALIEERNRPDTRADRR